ncbi:Protein CBG15254 [Caenorhabditis briggsae]|uniref:Protein CBG15254 n=1 Tax=Caenorhabditis briggsae TaxID=6238 RepID=A8XLK0_CAEBR|nr:Protein CBG15254 [Caenorhabditis briggsae]CAP33504.2 Protein CBG15254 [Caenorhabditis briggsae]
MSMQAWQSNPDLLENSEFTVTRPRNLNIIYPTDQRIYRSTSLGGGLNSSSFLNSPDDYELFYTPRATFNHRVPDKLLIPDIVLNSGSSDAGKSGRRGFSPKRFTVNQRMQKNRRFDTSSPFKHRDVRDLLKSAKRRLNKITGEEGRVQFALSQTPPVETVIASGPTPPRHQHSAGISNTSATTHHTLSPVIQCFQNDKRTIQLENQTRGI